MNQRFAFFREGGSAHDRGGFRSAATGRLSVYPMIYGIFLANVFCGVLSGEERPIQSSHLSERLRKSKQVSASPKDLRGVRRGHCSSPIFRTRKYTSSSQIETQLKRSQVNPVMPMVY